MMWNSKREASTPYLLADVNCQKAEGMNRSNGCRRQ